ncbi:MAG TPA: nitrate- and nitrite sensing domain-containing protein [Acidimicrobiales bacterium]
MRRVPIRLKLAAALSIPLLALGIVTVIEVLKAANTVDEVREQTDLAEAAIGPSGLITTLQNERTWPAVDLIGQVDSVNVPVEGYEQTRAETDRALALFREQVASKDDSIAQAFKPALDQLADLEQLRADIDQNVATVNPRTIENNIEFSHEAFDRYTRLIEPFFDATTRISLAIDDPELRQGTEMADAAARQIEVLSLLINGIFGDFFLTEGGLNTPAEMAASSTRQANFEGYAEVMRSGTGPYAAIADEYFPAELTEDVIEQSTLAITTNTLDQEVLFAAVNVPDDEGYLAYQKAVAAEIADRSQALNDAAEARQRWFIALAVLVLGTAIALTWLVSRSITKPLRSLTRQAKDMAERRLPDAVIDILETPLGDDVQVPSIEPVRLTTRDEVADVSAALNTVQDTALDLAVEQAVLRRNIADSFVNLGRRNQNLLGRQLDFITELETNETDPDTLANLFRLDHLATRMRRNAESLLVLAGIEPPRKWAAPVRLTDVIRAALGEVEDYQRVTVRGVEPATILGSAAADLAHLLAELIENALVFSPPDQTVDIRGRTRTDPYRSRPDSTDGAERDLHRPGYTLAIIDSGLGMPTPDITAANRRLAGAESFTIAPSKYLGHYVAGNLAARHNIHVHLDNSPGNGITATIDIPPTLLTTDTARADPVTPPHGIRALPTGTPEAPAVDEPARPAPDPAAPPAAMPPVEVTRTMSGLVKRTSRAGNGSTVGTDHPSGDLLDTLRRHTAKLQGEASTDARQPIPPAPPARPGEPWGQPLGPPTSPPPAEPGGPWGQPLGPPTSPPTAEPGGPWGQPLGPPTSPLTAEPSGWGPPSGSGPAPGPWTPPPAAPRSWPAPPPLPEPPPSTWSPTPAPPGWSPAPPTLPDSTGPLAGRAHPPGRSVGPSGPRPAGNGIGGGGNGATSGGLTRRVRGAQIPTTEPVRMHRAPEPSRPAGRPTTPPPRTAEQRRAADDVYSFLSSFTAGVRRGLDESATRRGPDDPSGPA